MPAGMARHGERSRVLNTLLVMLLFVVDGPKVTLQTPLAQAGYRTPSMPAHWRRPDRQN